MEIILLYNFKIAETKNFQKQKNKISQKIYTKIVDIVYPQLKQNPFYETNIKKLKGEFEGYYRYKVGDYRLFYLIEDKKIIVIITSLRHR